MISTNNEETKKILDTIRKYQNDYLVPIVKIASELDISVYLAELSKDISGAILKKDGKYVIYVNDKDNKKRQRFTIAHEIAHYILHKEQIGDNLTDNAMYRSKLSNTQERQANILASEILIPIHKLKEILNLKNYDIKSIANVFGVSRQAINIRINQGGNIFLEE